LRVEPLWLSMAINTAPEAVLQCRAVLGMRRAPDRLDTLGCTNCMQDLRRSELRKEYVSSICKKSPVD